VTLAGGVAPGASAPLGATATGRGVNFSVFAGSASRVDLLLFNGEQATEPARTIPLDPHSHRTHHYWHAFVPNIGPGQVYAYRADGPIDPTRGRYFDPAKVLLDPYGRAVAVPAGYDREAAARPGPNTATAMKSVVTAATAYDWEDDRPPNHPFTDTVIYELHVRGFTRHPSSGVGAATRGTYAGLIDKIPFLSDLGITAVELLPILQFDPQDAPTGRTNYWGYQPISFFAPHHAYSSQHTGLGVVDEFRDMVKALHRACIEVILDVVYDHTAEGCAGGPTMCYRGLANEVYYLRSRDGSEYADDTGCGNTLNAGHPIVRRLIQDSLRYWVTEMHVDGFRFDVASLLSRDESGRPFPNPPVLQDLQSDPILAGIKLLGDAWDERFRDDVRHFLRGDDNSVPHVARRLLGSPDIHGHREREPEPTVNFVTSHDGFTLNDLVSYNAKHNEANGEGNRDGADDNVSWNCGAEGLSGSPSVETLRNRQIKNFLALELLAAGTPLLLMGDEMRHTQLGNNNAYCQDNEISWLDWSKLRRHADVFRFARLLIAYRRGRDLSSRARHTSLNELLRQSHVEWHGVRLYRPDWSEHSHSLAFTFERPDAHYRLHAMLNAYWEPLTFEVPESKNGSAWRRCVDTALESPDDIQPIPKAPRVDQSLYIVEPRSVVLLAAVNHERGADSA
jgi:glycogen operon protein